MPLLGLDGTMVTVGLPDKPLSVSTFSLIVARRRLAGTNNGGIPQTQEMLDFYGRHGLGVTSRIAVQRSTRPGAAWLSDVKYRFVIDTA